MKSAYLETNPNHSLKENKGLWVIHNFIFFSGITLSLISDKQILEVHQAPNPKSDQNTLTSHRSHGSKAREISIFALVDFLKHVSIFQISCLSILFLSVSQFGSFLIFSLKFCDSMLCCLLNPSTMSVFNYKVFI
jgi:hypothetical protein